MPREKQDLFPITQVQKRDGRIVEFDSNRIQNAIFKAITAVEQGDGEMAKKLTKKVLNLLKRRFRKGEIPTVEQIQDIVEEVLILEGLVETAKAYILYREQRRRIRETITAIDEAVDLVDQYIREMDWQVKENANMTYSLQGLNHYVTAAVTKKYWLNKVYPKEVREAAFSGDFHIHNLDALATYCCGWDLYDLLLKGFRGVPGKVESRPAKHLRTALGQAVNFFYTLQGESAGAQAFSNFDTLLAPFIRYDNLNYAQVKQAIQEFLYNCAIPTRVGFQTPFTNITLDLKVPEHLKDQPVIIGGKPQKETYGEFQEEMNIFNRALYEGFMEGDAKGRVFSIKGDAFCLIKNSETIKLIKIGDYIDHLIEKHGFTFKIPSNQAEVLDTRKLNIKALGVRDGKLDWQKVNFVVRHPVDHYLKIFTWGGLNIEVTPAHSVLVLKDGQIQSFKASELKPGDYLLSPKVIPQKKTEKLHISLAQEFIKKEKEKGIYIRNVYRDGQPYYLKRQVVYKRNYGQKRYKYNQSISVFPLKKIASEIEKLDLTKAQISLRGSKITIPNLLLITPELVEFLGWYCAEGSVEENPQFDGLSFGLNLKKEKETALRIAYLAQKIFGPIPVKIREVKERNLVEVRIHSKLIKRILTEVFEVGNSPERKVPFFIFNLPSNYQKIFLRAYFKGNAWMNQRLIRVNTISKELAFGISTLLKQLQIPHTLNEYSWQGRKRWRVALWQNESLLPKDSRAISKIPLEESGILALVQKISRKEAYYYDSLGRRYKNTATRILQKFGIAHQKAISLKVLKKILEKAEKLGIEISPALKYLAKGELSLFKIKRIEKVKKREMVYDFSTESENFVANQLLVHNTFPIPTINITKDFDWDNPAYSLIWEATAKYGVNYFANFVQSDMSPEDARSMCCRLRLDNRELYKRGGGLFGSNPKTGSIGVVTINLPRIGYLSKTKKEFFERLAKIMDIAKESLEIKRKVLEDFMRKGLYPYSRFYLADVEKMRGQYFGNHFSTIGLVGMNEALLNFLGEDITSKRGRKFAIEVLDFMRERLVKYQEETGNLYNLEATPAESTAYRLALKDKERYPDIITAGKNAPYYTNSTQLPVGYTDDLFEALELQDDLQSRYTGGTVLHIFLGERVSDSETVKKMVKTIFDNFKLPYITFTPTFSVCPNHGYLPGEHFTCPKCVVDQPCEVYSRIVGYLRPVQQWNTGKQEEFSQRKVFKIKS